MPACMLMMLDARPSSSSSSIISRMPYSTHKGSAGKIFTSREKGVQEKEKLSYSIRKLQWPVDRLVIRHSVWCCFMLPTRPTDSPRRSVLHLRLARFFLFFARRLFVLLGPPGSSTRLMATSTSPPCCQEVYSTANSPFFLYCLFNLVHEGI